MEEAKRGRYMTGKLYCEAALKLKEAFGVNSDVFYHLEFFTQKVEPDTDFSSLDNGFRPGERWRMFFKDEPQEYISREIEILPKKDSVAIVQTVLCVWPGANNSKRDRLAVVDLQEFLDPEKWAVVCELLANEGDTAMKLAIKSFGPELEAHFEDGSIISKPELVDTMIKVCSERDLLLNVVNSFTDLIIAPEFPVNDEPRAIYRCFVTSLGAFTQNGLPEFCLSFKFEAKAFLSENFVHYFKKKYSIELPDDLDNKSAEAKIREMCPELAQEFEKEFQWKLDYGKVKLAWGFATDYKRVRAFCDAILSHPEIGFKKISTPFLVFCERPSEDSLRKSLNEAINLTLSPVITM